MKKTKDVLSKIDFLKSDGVIEIQIGGKSVNVKFSTFVNPGKEYLAVSRDDINLIDALNTTLDKIKRMYIRDFGC